MSSRTEHAEMHNGGRHKIDVYNSIKPFKKKEDRNLTISNYQSIHVTQRIEQVVGIMEHYNSITCDEFSMTSQ